MLLQQTYRHLPMYRYTLWQTDRQKHITRCIMTSRQTDGQTDSRQVMNLKHDRQTDSFQCINYITEDRRTNGQLSMHTCESWQTGRQLSMHKWHQGKTEGQMHKCETWHTDRQLSMHRHEGKTEGQTDSSQCINDITADRQTDRTPTSHFLHVRPSS